MNNFNSIKEMINYLDIHPNAILEVFNNMDDKLKIQIGKEVWENLIKPYIQNREGGMML